MAGHIGIHRVLRTTALLMFAVICLAVGIWGMGALWFQLSWPLVPKLSATGLWCVITLLAVRACLSPRHRWRWLAAMAAAFVLILAWWSTIEPSQDRDWADDVAQPLHARWQGDAVVIENVRNFQWRTESDYDVHWERRTYDLSQLRSADLVLSYWMGPAIAHTLVSFGFADGQQLVFSLEIRKERGESFSALGGFFRKFEVVLVASDERDIVRVRSNVRDEDVYLYRLHGLSQKDLKALFTAYLVQAEDLRRLPRFYNSLTSNCTTVVFELMRRVAPALPLDYRLILSGYLAEYAHDVGGLAPGFTYQQLQQRGRITQRARDAGQAADFSQKIRHEVPGIVQGNTP